MIRRFANIVVENYKARMFSLHRLDVTNNLFYPSRADAKVMPLLADPQSNTAAACGDEPTAMERLEELPAPCMKIQSPSTVLWPNSKLEFVGLLSPRSSEGKILCMNRDGNAVLCDADCNSTCFVPGLKDRVGPMPISVSVARPDAQDQEDLYIMYKIPMPGSKNSCFRLFRSGESERASCQWESLPPPPFVDNPQYSPSSIRSHTVVDGGRTICLSTAAKGIGTYCFDTVERQWRHAGQWMLPFDGPVWYVPDLKLWLGFSRDSPYYLCATSCLSTMAKDQPPKLEHAWQDLVTPKNWVTTGTDLLNLGAGRFCIAKSFQVSSHIGYTGIYDEWELEHDAVVLTGIEIGKGADEGLQALKHKTILLESMDICWVL